MQCCVWLAVCRPISDAGRYLQLPNVKPTQVCSAPAAIQAILANYFRRSAVV
jgi:hypothetical protein